MMKKTMPLLLAVLTLQGCMRYWHKAPFLDAGPKLLSNKTITVYSSYSRKHPPEKPYFEMALAKKGFYIVPYDEMKKLAAGQMDRYEPHVTFYLLTFLKDWISPELIESLKKEYGLDAILYESTYVYKYMGFWSARCEFTVIDVSTGNIFATGWLDVDGAFSPQDAMAKAARRVVDMMISSAKSGKRLNLGLIPIL